MFNQVRQNDSVKLHYESLSSDTRHTAWRGSVYPLQSLVLVTERKPNFKASVLRYLCSPCDYPVFGLIPPPCYRLLRFVAIRPRTPHPSILASTIHPPHTPSPPHFNPLRFPNHSLVNSRKRLSVIQEEM